MAALCVLVFVLLVNLDVVGAPSCYNIIKYKKYDGGTLDPACHDPHCCAEKVATGGYVASEIFANCTVFSSTPTTSTAGNAIMFQKWATCDPVDMCLSPNTCLDGSSAMYEVKSLEDCLSICRWGLNCSGVSYIAEDEYCFWTASTLITYAPCIGVYFKCDLTTTSTTTTTTTTTTPTTTSTTTTTTTTSTSTTTTTTTTSTTTTTTTTTTPTTTSTTTTTTTTTGTTASTVSSTTTPTTTSAMSTPSTTQAPLAVSQSTTTSPISATLSTAAVSTAAVSTTSTTSTTPQHSSSTNPATSTSVPQTTGSVTAESTTSTSTILPPATTGPATGPGIATTQTTPGSTDQTSTSSTTSAPATTGASPSSTPVSQPSATTQAPSSISKSPNVLELEAPAETGSILDLHQHGVDIQHCTSFVYQVQGCQEHGLSLLDADGAELVSLVIGSDSNTMSGVSGGPSVSTPDILSCTEFRWFWVKWTGNRLLYGSGMDTAAAATIDYTDDVILLVKRVGLKKINTSPSVTRVGSDGNSRVYKVFGAGRFADGEIEGTPTYQLTDSRCAIECSKNPDCGMFSFNQAEGLCNIFNRMTSSFTVTSSADWQSWAMLYCN